jgi:quinoprotein dehydrogenase-associated probable ABC transporter substrate-binding protein
MSSALNANSSRHLLGVLAFALAISTSLTGSATDRTPFRVCADPNNLPFSNVKGQGFENRIAVLIARALDRPLAYFWLPQRRGFIRNSLNAGRCDVVMGVPAHYQRLQTTRAYYRSSYVFVARQDRRLDVRSFDDRRLQRLTIGIQVTGDDYANPPAAQALAVRNLAANVRGYAVYGDYSVPEPQREILDAVADGRIDLAVVWGPLAGYYARREPVTMRLAPIRSDPKNPSAAFAFEIAMGMRRDDSALRERLDAIIERRLPAIHEILRSYGVPLL